MCKYLSFWLLFICNTALDCGIKPDGNKNKSQNNNQNKNVAKRIVGGNAADPGEWPWQVLLQWENGTASYKRYCNSSYCSGAILSKYFVLTAAHCYENGKIHCSLIMLLSRSEDDISLQWLSLQLEYIPRINFLDFSPTFEKHIIDTVSIN